MSKLAGKTHNLRWRSATMRTDTAAAHPQPQFDAIAKEESLRAEAEQWNIPAFPVDAAPGDIPVINLREFLASTTTTSATLDTLANQLKIACETVGFWQLVGYEQVLPPHLIQDVFAAAARLHALPLHVKLQILMDRPDWKLGGVGYLPVGERKLPRRRKGNLNEAFLLKSGRDIDCMDDNQWPDEQQLPGFREAVLRYATALETLARRLLPLYARALGVADDFFAKGFESPFWRLRLSHYPASESRTSFSGENGLTTDDLDFGIAPHVDTSFFTLLLQDSPGLVIYHTPRNEWIKVPLVQDAIVVNSGELLKQWTNDRFLSVRHFAMNQNTAGVSRYSIPFFFNAADDYPMVCIPTCCGEEHPAKYPPISYKESQGVVQGE